MVLCPHCDNQVPARHLAPEAGTGQCPSCDHVFALDQAALAPAGAHHVDLDVWPVGVEVVREGPDLHIAVRWQTAHQGLPILAAGLFVVGINLSYGVTGMIGALGGLAMCWFGAALALDTTLISVQDGRLTVHHGPLPYPGGRSIRLERLGAFRIGTRTQRSTRNPVQVWDLWARTDLGEVKLMSGYQDERVPEFVGAVLDDQLRG